MSSSTRSTSNVFSIAEHRVPCQHIREYPRATAGPQEDTQFLAVKQYVPLDNASPCPGDVTVIAAHAAGIPKTYNQSTASWLDHSRDLLHMINTFRDEMPRPLVGMGHSMGGCHLTTLSLIHPRLLSKLILIDPVITSFEGGVAPSTVRASAFRVDVWKSRADAERSFRKRKSYQSWDARVFDRWMRFGLRDVPTLVHPDLKDGQVTLSTTKHQEVFSFFRPAFQRKTQGGGEHVVNRDMLPDYDPTVWARDDPFYRPEPPVALKMMPHLRPNVLFIFPGQSNIGTPEVQRVLMQETGSGIGGSGGAKEGAVSKHVFEKLGHLVPMQDPEGCAVVLSAWLGRELKSWAEKEVVFRNEWARVQPREKAMVSEEWKVEIGDSFKPPGAKL